MGRSSDSRTASGWSSWRPCGTPPLVSASLAGSPSGITGRRSRPPRRVARHRRAPSCAIADYSSCSTTASTWWRPAREPRPRRAGCVPGRHRARHQPRRLLAVGRRNWCWWCRRFIAPGRPVRREELVGSDAGASSASGRGRPAGFASPTATPPPWPASAGGSTASPLRSSSPPPGSGCSAPELIAERLDERLRLLAAAPRRPARHRTLGAALDWSHDLLAPPRGAGPAPAGGHPG